MVSTGVSTTSPAAARSRSCWDLRRSSSALAIIDAAANRSATPRLVLTTPWVCAPSPIQRSTSTPGNADGTEPITSHFTRLRLTVPRRRCTAPPTGFITIDATRSLDTAASGWMPNSRIIIGVIRAPPPMPVMPDHEADEQPGDGDRPPAGIHAGRA